MRVASLPGAAIRRCLGLVRHRPESWAVAEWERAYSSGQLAYFSDMDELARYSLLAGYVRYIGERPDILDIGCGEGLLRRHLDGVPIGHYTGIDLCSTAIRACKGTQRRLHNVPLRGRHVDRARLGRSSSFSTRCSTSRTTRRRCWRGSPGFCVPTVIFSCQSGGTLATGTYGAISGATSGSRTLSRSRIPRADWPGEAGGSPATGQGRRRAVGE